MNNKQIKYKLFSFMNGFYVNLESRLAQSCKFTLITGPANPLVLGLLVYLQILGKRGGELTLVTLLSYSYTRVYILYIFIFGQQKSAVEKKQTGINVVLRNYNPLFLNTLFQVVDGHLFISKRNKILRSTLFRCPFRKIKDNLKNQGKTV